MSTNRQQLLEQLADLIVALARPHPVRVAIDGIDAAGKTTLADELVTPVSDRGRSTLRVSVDGFHHPRAVRYRQGPDSPTGYYHDSFNYPAVVNQVLIPLGPGGSRRYRRAIFDVNKDLPVQEPLYEAPANAILLMDGVFLMRPELNPFWDFRVLVHVGFETTIARAVERGKQLFGSAEGIEARYRQRYVPGQRLYLDTVRPWNLADVIVDNRELATPGLWVRGQGQPRLAHGGEPVTAIQGLQGLLSEEAQTGGGRIG